MFRAALFLISKNWEQPRCLLWMEGLWPPAPEFVCWSFAPCDVSGDRTFVGWLGHEGGALVNGVSALTRRDTKAGSLSPVWAQVRRQRPAHQEKWPQNEYAASTLNFPASRRVRNKFLLCKPPSPWCFVPNCPIQWSPPKEMENTCFMQWVLCSNKRN